VKISSAQPVVRNSRPMVCVKATSIPPRIQDIVPENWIDEFLKSFDPVATACVTIFTVYLKFVIYRRPAGAAEEMQ
jgi:hypothetical protein